MSFRPEVINIRSATDASTFIYVGRRCRHPVLGWLKAHPLANPFKVRRGASAAERAECLEKYRRWLDEQPYRLIQHLGRTAMRTGLPLGCWCKPDPYCHADVLAEAIEKMGLDKEPN